MATATKKKDKSTTLAKRKPGKDFLEDLRNKANKDGKGLDDMGFAAVLAGLQNSGEITSASELGTGWAILNNKEKSRLVGVPLLILSWNFNEGDNGEFVSLQVLTNSERIIVNDGSTGIYQQIKERDEAREPGWDNAIYCKHGLRESKYEYEDPKTGEKKPASTFYIDTSA